MLVGIGFLLATVVAVEVNDPPLCTLDVVNKSGVMSVQANVKAVETGTLTYRVNTTVTTGSNRSLSLNGGEVEIIKGRTPVTIWRAKYSVSNQSTMVITLEAKLNTKQIYCEFEFP